MRLLYVCAYYYYYNTKLVSAITDTSLHHFQIHSKHQPWLTIFIFSSMVHIIQSNNHQNHIQNWSIKYRYCMHAMFDSKFTDGPSVSLKSVSCTNWVFSASPYWHSCCKDQWSAAEQARCAREVRHTQGPNHKWDCKTMSKSTSNKQHTRGWAGLHAYPTKLCIQLHALIIFW